MSNKLFSEIEDEVQREILILTLYGNIIKAIKESTPCSSDLKRLKELDPDVYVVVRNLETELKFFTRTRFKAIIKIRDKVEKDCSIRITKKKIEIKCEQFNYNIPIRDVMVGPGDYASQVGLMMTNFGLFMTNKRFSRQLGERIVVYFESMKEMSKAMESLRKSSNKSIFGKLTLIRAFDETLWIVKTKKGKYIIELDRNTFGIKKVHVGIKRKRFGHNKFTDVYSFQFESRRKGDEQTYYNSFNGISESDFETLDEIFNFERFEERFK